MLIFPDFVTSRGIAQYIEISAKNNINCDEALFVAASTIMQSLQEGKYSAEVDFRLVAFLTFKTAFLLNSRR
jgi:hypothetical protein